MNNATCVNLSPAIADSDWLQNCQCGLIDLERLVVAVALARGHVDHVDGVQDVAAVEMANAKSTWQERSLLSFFLSFFFSFYALPSFWSFFSLFLSLLSLSQAELPFPEVANLNSNAFPLI